MRRVALLLAAFLFVGVNSFAQNEPKAKTLKDNLAKSDEAITNPKKESNPATWMSRGKLYQDIYNLNIGFLRFGMPTTEAIIYFKEPKQKLTSEDESGSKETYEYSQIKLNFLNGGLQTWEETQSIVDNPLAEAVKAYQKASSLDEKGKNTKKINEAYRIITTDLETKAFNEFYRHDYKEAYSTILQKESVSKLLGVTDTMAYYYAGFFAYAQSEIDSSMWNEAITNFEKALAAGFSDTGETKGQIYNLLFNASLSSGKDNDALKYAQAGFNKYPDVVEMTYNLINYYLMHEQSQEALDYIQKAKASDPNNANLLYAEGSLYDKLGEKDKAIAAYDAAIAADPNKYDVYYNKAVVLYNSALKLMDDANSAKTNDEFEKKRDIAEAEFMRAVTPLEKAHELNPSEKEIMETLRSLYYRLKNKYPELESKYNEITQKLNL